MAPGKPFIITCTWPGTTLIPRAAHMHKLSKISRILTSTWDTKPGAASNLKKRRSREVFTKQAGALQHEAGRTDGWRGELFLC
eukprot:7626647-Alexandrium_andersonii.AAC.1